MEESDYFRVGRKFRSVSTVVKVLYETVRVRVVWDVGGD